MLENKEPVCNENVRVNGQKLKYRKFNLNVRSDCEGSQTVEQDIQKGCGISSLREFENPSGEGPEQRVLSNAVLSRGVGLKTCRGPFTLQPSYDSVITITCVTT